MKTTRSSMMVGSLLLVLAIYPAGAATKQAVPDYRKLKYPKLPEIKIPDVTRVTLPNGMKLLLLEDHELPLVDAEVAARDADIVVFLVAHSQFTELAKQLPPEKIVVDPVGLRSA